MNTNPNQLLLYKLYFTMSISNWLVLTARAYINTYINSDRYQITVTSVNVDAW